MFSDTLLKYSSKMTFSLKCWKMHFKGGWSRNNDKFLQSFLYSLNVPNIIVLNLWHQKWFGGWVVCSGNKSELNSKAAKLRVIKCILVHEDNVFSINIHYQVPKNEALFLCYLHLGFCTSLKVIFPGRRQFTGDKVQWVILIWELKQADPLM